jgi:hypothetical protein
MTLFEQHFSMLRESYSDATNQALKDGSIAVVVPNIPLPEGWTATTATIRFKAPVGYPLSRPDCFWTDPDLRLKDGKLPQNTGQNQMPEEPSALLWFSWHLQSWSPNADTLITYLNVIRRRFQELR